MDGNSQHVYSDLVRSGLAGAFPLRWPADDGGAKHGEGRQGPRRESRDSRNTNDGSCDFGQPAGVCIWRVFCSPGLRVLLLLSISNCSWGSTRLQTNGFRKKAPYGKTVCRLTCYAKRTSRVSVLG